MAKLFEENAYTKEIETKIKEIDEENKTYRIRGYNILWEKWWSTRR